MSMHLSRRNAFISKLSRPVMAFAVLGIFLAGCVSDAEYNSAIMRLDSEWKTANEQTLHTKGRRIVTLSRADALLAARGASRKLGMLVEKENVETGFLLVTAAAPTPLSRSEWKEVQSADTAKMKSVIAKDVGLASWFATLDPSAKDVLANVLVTEKREGVEVSIGIRLRNKRVVTGRIRRSEPPPTALRIGLRKFWSAFDDELGAMSVSRRATVVPPPAPKSQKAKPPIPRAVSVASVKQTEPKKTVRTGSFSDLHFGNYYALVIGNNRYRYLSKLKTAVNDATGVAKILEREYGFTVDVLLDAERSDILRALANLRSRLNFDEILLIYYAGHGLLDEVGQEGYWLPTDAESGIPSYWISTSDITVMLRAMRAKHVMVVADSCYSGTLVRSDAKAPKTATARRAWIERMLSKRSRVALVSGGLEPVVDGGGDGDHSVFATAFMHVLKENDSVIDGRSLFERIKRPVVLNTRQTPQFSDIRRAGHDGGDFLLIRRN